MLRRNNDRINASRLVLNILHSNLRFAVGTQVGKQAVLSDSGQLHRKLVRKRNRKRHQLFRLIAGITKHKTLVSCSRVQTIALLTRFRLSAFINAECNVSGLLMQRADYCASIAIKSVFRIVIADFANSLARNLCNIHSRVGRNLAHDSDHARSRKGFASNAGHRILRKHSIENAIRDFVANFVRMSFSDRLGCKKIFIHMSSLFVEKKSPRAEIPRAKISSLRIWHLSFRRLPGFIGPVPPPLLIRKYSITDSIVS